MCLFLGVSWVVWCSYVSVVLLKCLFGLVWVCVCVVLIRIIGLFGVSVMVCV